MPAAARGATFVTSGVRKPSQFRTHAVQQTNAHEIRFVARFPVSMSVTALMALVV